MTKGNLKALKILHAWVKKVKVLEGQTEARCQKDGTWIIRGEKHCFKCENQVYSSDDLVMCPVNFEGRHLGAMFHHLCWESLGLGEGEAYIVENPLL